MDTAGCVPAWSPWRSTRWASCDLPHRRHGGSAPRRHRPVARFARAGVRVVLRRGRAPVDPVPARIQRSGCTASLRIGLAIYAAALLGMAVTASSTVAMSAFAGVAGIGTALTRTASSVLVTWHSEPAAGRRVRSQAQFDLRSRRWSPGCRCPTRPDDRLALGVRDRGGAGADRGGDGPAIGWTVGARRETGQADLSRWQLTVVGDELRARRRRGRFARGVQREHRGVGRARARGPPAFSSRWAAWWDWPVGWVSATGRTGGRAISSIWSRG